MLKGLHRVGKTTIIKCLIGYLGDHKSIALRRCLYVSMADYQISTMSLIDVIDAYRKIIKLSVMQKIDVFFDEITYIRFITENFAEYLPNF